jgi:hypothetical protein
MFLEHWTMGKAQKSSNATRHRHNPLESIQYLYHTSDTNFVSNAFAALQHVIKDILALAEMMDSAQINKIVLKVLLHQQI